ncbi:hypothetical protein GCM10009544_34820 [Streptomyces stramineus]|uniref:Transposase n=1 Tax=Streptomyces stramineus TaxID=173861 RepID=A0ABP3K3K7_9ACTN
MGKPRRCAAHGLSSNSPSYRWEVPPDGLDWPDGPSFAVRLQPVRRLGPALQGRAPPPHPGHRRKVPRAPEQARFQPVRRLRTKPHSPRAPRPSPEGMPERAAPQPVRRLRTAPRPGPVREQDTAARDPQPYG